MTELDDAVNHYFSQRNRETRWWKIKKATERDYIRVAPSMRQYREKRETKLCGYNTKWWPGMPKHIQLTARTNG